MISSSTVRFTKAAVARSGALHTMLRPAATSASKIVRPLAASLSDFRVRHKSAVAAVEPGTFMNGVAFIEKPLKALDTATVRRIKEELMEVDKNCDGRLDSDELKTLLRKHSTTFTDEEIVELGELYYAAKAGGSIRFDNFLEAIDIVADKNAKALAMGVDIDSENDFEDLQNPMGLRRDNLEYYNLGKPHGHYTEEMLDVKLTHVEPKGLMDEAAYKAVRVVRFLFDTATGWRMDNIRVDNTLNRVIYLETIAAVPGMVAAVIRHFRSLRKMKSDGGMLQLFLEEANNERMHLLTFVNMKDPGLLFRAAVIGGQFGFGAAFTTAYLISPAFCHRFVGYVEEEACSTYTKIIKAIETAPEGSDIAAWKTKAPPKIAKAYWKLGEDSTVLDLMKAVRADEAEHRDVNHAVSGLKEGDTNPFYDPEYKLNMMLSKYVRDMMTRGKDQ